MLISYSIENYKSYRNKKRFDLFCTNSKVKKRYVENYISKNDVDVFKTAIIVGENAGGKTNLISSFSFLKDGLFSMVDDKIKTYKNLCFFNNYDLNNTELSKHFVSSTRQSYELEVLADDDFIYTYCLIIDAFGIVEEKFYKRKNFKETKHPIFEVVSSDLFKRTKEKKFQRKYTYSLSDDFNLDGNGKPIVDKSFFEDKKFNGLFVKVLALMGSPEAMSFMNWINKKMSVNFERLPLDLYYRIKNENTFSEELITTLNTKEFLDIFRLVDSSIVSIKIDHQKPFEDTMIVRKIGKKYIESKLSGDSSGVKQFFALSYEIYKVIYEGKVIIADEYDSFLNPILTSRLISYINSFDNCGQFIFTTHNITHLNFQVFMKEQMFVVQKDNNTLESDLYSLCRFNGLRYDANQKIYELYLKGLLGGVDNG